MGGLSGIYVNTIKYRLSFTLHAGINRQGKVIESRSHFIHHVGKPCGIDLFQKTATGIAQPKGKDPRRRRLFANDEF